MNPTIDQRIIDEALAEDPSAAGAEYLAEFRKDIESFVAREAVESCVIPGRHELPRFSQFRYVGFVDPSGGSQDSMTLAIAHRDEEKGVLDAIREVRPPFNPESVVEEFASLLASYGIFEVYGDRYGGEWPRSVFRKHGIRYEPNVEPKSDLYRNLLPLINSGRVELLDHPRLIAQLCNLERRTARSGRDSIDHGPNAHDDVANAAAGSLTLAAKKPPETRIIQSLGVW
jgi:hypothetical protein